MVKLPVLVTRIAQHPYNFYEVLSKAPMFIHYSVKTSCLHGCLQLGRKKNRLTHPLHNWLRRRTSSKSHSSLSEQVLLILDAVFLRNCHLIRLVVFLSFCLQTRNLFRLHEYNIYIYVLPWSCKFSIQFIDDWILLGEIWGCLKDSYSLEFIVKTFKHWYLSYKLQFKNGSTLGFTSPLIHMFCNSKLFNHSCTFMIDRPLDRQPGSKLVRQLESWSVGQLANQIVS